MNKVESFQLSDGNKVSIDLGVCGYGFEGPATVIIVKESQVKGHPLGDALNQRGEYGSPGIDPTENLECCTNPYYKRRFNQSQISFGR